MKYIITPIAKLLAAILLTLYVFLTTTLGVIIASVWYGNLDAFSIFTEEHIFDNTYSSRIVPSPYFHTNFKGKFRFKTFYHYIWGINPVEIK